MGTSAENFCLRWNDFEANVSSSFRELRDDSDFFDVTLVTSDSGNQTLQAHKVILSACSTFFKQMLRQQNKLHSHPNPLIFLRGVTYNDLLYVLDFMYHGEVNVAQEDLNSFLAVAEELQIKGLTNKDQAEAGSSNDKLSKFMAGRLKDRGGPPPKRIRKSSDHSQMAPVASTSNNDVLQNVDVKIDPEVSMSVEPDEAENPDDPEGFDDTYGDYYDETSGGMEGDGADGSGTKDRNERMFRQRKNSTKDLNKPSQQQIQPIPVTPDQDVPHMALNPSGDPDEQLMKMLQQQGQSWTCKVCGRTGNRRDNMKRHVENLHLPRVLRCKLCQMLVRNHQMFYRHMRSKHGISTMRETEQYKEDPCDPNLTGGQDHSGNPVGSYDDDDCEDDHFLGKLLKVEHAT